MTVMDLSLTTFSPPQCFGSESKLTTAAVAMKKDKRQNERPHRSSGPANTTDTKGVHGLVGLEISSLRKSLNGGTHYNFDWFLANSIPEQYTIEIIDDEARSNELLDQKPALRLCDNDEIRDMSYPKGTFDELRRSLAGKFVTNLVDHQKNKGPSRLIYTVGSDPLADVMYTKTHEKLARRERKFNLADRTRMLNEVDNCIELLSVLGTDIKRGTLRETLRNYIVEDVELSEEQIYRLSQLLGTITSLNDPTDSIEMVLKYRLTIREIRLFLLNYVKIKTLEGFLKKEVQKVHMERIRRYEEPVTESNTSALRDRRLSDRNARMGKIVKVKFKGGVTLLIDPICKPKVTIPK